MPDSTSRAREPGDADPPREPRGRHERPTEPRKHERESVSRRTFLKGAAAVGGAAAIGGAAYGISQIGGGATSAPTPRPTKPKGRVITPSVTSAPPTIAPAAVDTRWPIKHVIYVMLENRSFNHLFGNFPGAMNTVKVGVRDGREVPLTRAPEWLPGDLPHDRNAALIDVAGGRMDGFANHDGAPFLDSAFTVYDREDIANWWTWAERFVLCDNFFASANTASQPNHMFMIAGTSGGAFDNPIDDNKGPGPGLAKSWGCDALETAYVEIFDERTGKHLRNEFPCFTFDTQGEQLSRKGVDWAFYAAEDSEAGYIWNAYAAVGAVRKTNLWDEHIRDVDALIADIAAGRLPSVAWVTPRYELSDHPPYSTIWAQNWVTRVVNAVMRSPAWWQTAMFVTWDEWGGTYDPVPPPRVDALGLGVRVPMLVISPWANGGMLDHEVGEFCSPNKFVADNWDLAYLTDRVRSTHNFEHVFDFHRPRSKLIAPDPQRLVKPGPLPKTPPAANIGWPPPISD
jgi:phospholipase C